MRLSNIRAAAPEAIQLHLLCGSQANDLFQSADVNIAVVALNHPTEHQILHHTLNRSAKE